MIASINMQTGDIKLVSVFRDTYLNLGNDTYNKCNAAYAKGGPEQAINMLNMNLDLNIEDYVTVGFTGLIETIDAIGGVEIEILEEEIRHRDAAVHELEDKQRNIDAYLEALYQIPDLKEKQALFDGTKNEVLQAFAAMQKNMDRAANDITDCEPLLNENIERSEKTLASVRKAVAKMKEGSV